MAEDRLTIPLGAHEVQYCALLAERRNVVKGIHGVPSQRFQRGKTDFETHLIGIMGEYAVAKHFGIKVDNSVSLSGDDKVSDLRIGSHRVQVKARLPQKPPLYLYFNSPSLFLADRTFCTCVASPATVQLCGWIEREFFLNNCQKLNFGYGDRFGVPEDLLKGVEEWH